MAAPRLLVFSGSFCDGFLTTRFASPAARKLASLTAEVRLARLEL